ncbi:MAG: ferritin [Candidatus Omnitrophota bacterium]|jgi:ferritin|nr:MAG: ferritin [Candidatus Omnitrophota bacterium]
MDQKMNNALNDQINAELFSSYLYLSMSAYFESVNLSGFAGWMRAQAQEELLHVSKFFKYINDRNGRVVLKAIEEPQKDWASPLAAFEDAYAHEQKVTKLINDLVDLALSMKDHTTNSFLQWFVTEQIEEEATASQIVDQLKLIGDARSGLFMLNKELGARTFTAAADAE